MELLTERAHLRSPDDPVVSETIFDTKSDRYQLVNVGWKDDSTRIYGCVLHVDIKDGKIWVQHDGTKENQTPQQLGNPLNVPLTGDDKPFSFGFGSLLTEPTILPGAGRKKPVLQDNRQSFVFPIVVYARQKTGDTQFLL